MPYINDPDDIENSDDANDTGGGEDDRSTEKNGDDSHLHDDQKSRTLKS